MAISANVTVHVRDELPIELKPTPYMDLYTLRVGNVWDLSAIAFIGTLDQLRAHVNRLARSVGLVTLEAIVPGQHPANEERA